MTEVTVYFLGYDPEEALDSLVFDSYDSADEYWVDDNAAVPDLNIYSFSFTVHAVDLKAVN